MQESFLKYFTVFFLSIIKIYGGVIYGVAQKLHLLEIALFVTLGSCSTVALVMLLGNKYRPWIAKIFSKVKYLYYDIVLILANLFLSTEKFYSLKRKLVFKRKPSKFSKTIRLVVKVWRLFGTSGVSFLTPLMLSPIGGAIIAVSFRAKFKKTMFYMTLFHFLFAVLFSYTFTEFGDLIERQFGINLGRQG